MLVEYNSPGVPLSSLVYGETFIELSNKTVFMKTNGRAVDPFMGSGSYQGEVLCVNLADGSCIPFLRDEKVLPLPGKFTPIAKGA